MFAKSSSRFTRHGLISPTSAHHLIFTLRPDFINLGASTSVHIRLDLVKRHRSQTYKIEPTRSARPLPSPYRSMLLSSLLICVGNLPSHSHLHHHLPQQYHNLATTRKKFHHLNIATLIYTNNSIVMKVKMSFGELPHAIQMRFFHAPKKYILMSKLRQSSLTRCLLFY